MAANFTRNTDITTPVLFYFNRAEDLLDFETFEVIETPIARPHQLPATVTVWSVVGKTRKTVKGGWPMGIVAEFPLQLYAEIFRDMASGFVRRT